MPILPLTPVSDRWSLLNRSVLLRLVTTVSSVVIALGVTELLWLLADRPVSAPLFLVAIVVSAWICGFRYGFLAAVLGGVAIDFFFIQPRYEFSGSRDELVRLLIFFFEGATLTWLIERLRLAGAALEIKNRELSALSSHQQNLREEEQKRIAREVHDELGQALTGLKMNIHLLKKQAAKVPAGDNLIASGLNELMEMTDSTILTVRRIASELRPSLLDDFGLVPAVEWQAQEFQRRTSIACEFTTTDESIDLGPEKNSAIYRIVQEALTNVARHANASRVAVAILTGNDEVNVTISDNGVGIMGSAALKPSFGLIGMQERSRMIGGELGIGRHPLEGTSVSLRIPLERDPNRNGSAK